MQDRVRRKAKESLEPKSNFWPRQITIILFVRHRIRLIDTSSYMKNPLSREDFSVGTCIFFRSMLYCICECEVVSHFYITIYVPQKTPSGVFCFYMIIEQ